MGREGESEGGGREGGEREAHAVFKHTLNTLPLLHRALFSSLLFLAKHTHTLTLLPCKVPALWGGVTPTCGGPRARYAPSVCPSVRLFLLQHVSECVAVETPGCICRMHGEGLPAAENGESERASEPGSLSCRT